ncbi:SGNH/GDSL hydrolase family protein [uncultured Arthrobacter sp.]|uniref:SGNH/GDSL hydrolase family protein n=1 Tax=uncultured Arthrobacter sp. TaxID=114050 RepID=UPI00261CBBE5|nr:SGNH/GDSL hydrolase family protein [uncultured Arthrobacter sp.]
MHSNADSDKAPPVLVSYGHSWVAGDGASFSRTSFAALAARELELALDNRAVGGSSSTATAELVVSSPPPPAPLYVVMTGLNDLRLHGEESFALSGYSGVLRRILTALRRTSPNSLVVAVAQPYLVDFSLYPPHNRGNNQLVDDYNSVLRRASAEYSFVALAETDHWDAELMLHEDTVHPNDAGHACLAQAVLHAVASRRS